MNEQDEAALQRLRTIFQAEAQEHSQAMTQGLIALEQAATPAARAALVETVYREVHSLKGAARVVNLSLIEALCQQLEGVFAALKRQATPVGPDLLDLLHQAVGVLDALLLAPDAPRSPVEEEFLRELDWRLAAVPGDLGLVPAPGGAPAATNGAGGPVWTGADERPVFGDTVRIATAKLDTLLLQTEELLAVRQTGEQRVAELRALGTQLSAWQRAQDRIGDAMRTFQRARPPAGDRPGRSLGPGTTDRLLGDLFAYLEWNAAQVQAFGGQVRALGQAAEHDQRTLAGLTAALLAGMKQVLMLPGATLLEIFPKMVRDLARTQGKEVDLVIRGGEIEIDRRILEELKDPLIHLLRNALDHGIERPEVRAQAHKPPRGRVAITIAQLDSSKVEIRIADDGAGIDRGQVQAAARAAGWEGADDADAAQALIFQSGVSTSPLITELSGRGLGLAIVREKVEKLGGTVFVESQPGAGTTFRLVLPLTLATFRGILVQVAGRVFVLPTISVERVIWVDPATIRPVENRETVLLDGQVVALVRLADLLALPRPPAGRDAALGGPAVVLRAGRGPIAFLVDAVLDEQEVLVKGLGPQLLRVRHIAGATVLGGGQVAPILNIADLLHTATQGAAGAAAPADQAAPAPRKAILIVEDSITSRTLLKNILETAGYAVQTAVDGAAGLAQLTAGAFDLVVSDVEMPQMNGFDLTMQIRATPALADLPVVLVTSLESREDRARGAAAGANAYLVKRSFDQSNLLDVIGRLL
ncbi:MAG TPA: response regulator [Chloroflexia bacterium]|nr:response regulator [Chloroflexia bacterium]